MGIFNYFQKIGLEKQIARDERSIDSTWKRLKNSKDFSQEDLWMSDWYLQLKEKYKHDLKKLSEIVADWRDYLDHQFGFYYGIAAMGSEEIKDELDDGAKEDSASMFQIENRFASLLGKEYEDSLKKRRGQTA